VRQYAKLRTAIGQTFAQIWRIVNYFSIWRPSAIWICYSLIWTIAKSICRCAKFGWNRRSSFNNIQVFTFCEFGLKMPIHIRFFFFFGGGGFNPVRGEAYQRKFKRHILPRKDRICHTDHQNRSTVRMTKTPKRRRQRQKPYSGKLGIRPDHPRSQIEIRFCVR